MEAQWEYRGEDKLEVSWEQVSEWISKANLMDYFDKILCFEWFWSCQEESGTMELTLTKSKIKEGIALWIIRISNAKHCFQSSKYVLFWTGLWTIVE